MDAKELRSRSVPELADELVKLRKEQFALRMQRATGQQPKPDQFGKVRRNIARLKTVLREKQAPGAGRGRVATSVRSTCSRCRPGTCSTQRNTAPRGGRSTATFRGTSRRRAAVPTPATGAPSPPSVAVTNNARRVRLPGKSAASRTRSLRITSGL